MEVNNGTCGQEPPCRRQEKVSFSDKHIQMARELGMNPNKFGSLANHKQEKWKSPLPEFIEELYFKRFRKERPDVIE